MRHLMKRICVVLLGTLLGTVTGMAQNPNVAPHAAAGAGHYLVAGSLDVEFTFFAFQQPNGKFFGAFHEVTNDGVGNVEFYARVTCLAVDPVEHRAWIGGVITSNLSTSSDFTDEIHQPGHDVWFRILDSNDPNQPSRSTFMGFEGAIPSSAAYCALRPWAPDNARTWPVTQGGLTVK